MGNNNSKVTKIKVTDSSSETIEDRINALVAGSKKISSQKAAGAKVSSAAKPTASTTRSAASTTRSAASTEKSAPSAKKSAAVAKVKPRPLVKTTKKPKKKLDTSKIIIKDAEVVPSTPKKIIITSEEVSPTEAPAATKDTAKDSAKSNKKIKVKAKEPKSVKLPRVRRVYIKVRYIIVSVIVLLIAGFFGRVAIWEHNYLIAMEGSERDVTVSEAYETEEGEEVDTTEPTEQEVYEYHVAPGKPRYLTIRTIGVYNSRVREIGKLASGAIDTPVNIYDVGWYTGSSLPGKPGVTVIDGHGGDLGYGIFRYLPRIGIGDEIVIEMGDEVTKYTYRVVEKAYRHIGEEANSYMNTDAFTAIAGAKGTLTLITCTGDWLVSQQTYDQRLFVRAILEN